MAGASPVAGAMGEHGKVHQGGEGGLRDPRPDRWCEGAAPEGAVASGAACAGWLAGAARRGPMKERLLAVGMVHQCAALKVDVEAPRSGARRGPPSCEEGEAAEGWVRGARRRGEGVPQGSRSRGTGPQGDGGGVRISAVGAQSGGEGGADAPPRERVLDDVAADTELRRRRRLTT